jgi:hypothetical protein
VQSFTVVMSKLSAGSAPTTAVSGVFVYPIWQTGGVEVLVELLPGLRVCIIVEKGVGVVVELPGIIVEKGVGVVVELPGIIVEKGVGVVVVVELPVVELEVGVAVLIGCGMTVVFNGTVVRNVGICVVSCA